MKKKPLFIVFEGIDGSGKSTQAALLFKKMKEKGEQVHLTCEPTTGPIGSLIRNIFSGRIEGDHRTIAGLFVADRLDHLLNTTNGVIEKLNQGTHVISDRYCLSSYAYQGTHMPMDWVIEANSQATALLKPDVHIYIDIDPKVSMERMSRSRSSAEMYETLENLKKVRENYRIAIEKISSDEKVVVLDGNKDADDLADEIFALVEAM